MNLFLRNVYFSYDETFSLENISLSFDSGDIHLIMGPSGAGKSTVAYIISGLLNPEKGRIISPGRKVDELQKEIGLLFQFPEDFFFSDTVEEEISFGPRKRGAVNIRERVHDAVEKVGLEEEILLKAPHSISDGEKRLVAIASILASEPSWFIMDEPFCNLDWQLKNRIIGVIRDISAEMGVVIITHQINDIIGIVDKVSLIDSGEIIFSGIPDEIDWNEVYSRGCDIPESIKIAKELRLNGIEASMEYTLQGLINSLKSN